MSVLAARHLSKRYRQREVVKDVNLAIQDGEIVGLLGPNGAGKTTSFYMIVGLVPCDEGTIHLDQHDLTQLPIDRRARLGLGYLPQEASIFRKLTVEENLLAVLQLVPGLSPDQQWQQAEALLREFNLETVRKSLGVSLSGGERRRVEIARALALRPRFLLLDEPFAGVDPISVSGIQEIIRQLSARGIGVLVTDHNVRETLTICHRAYIVNEGHIIAEGTPQSILEHKQVRNVYLGDGFRM